MTDFFFCQITHAKCHKAESFSGQAFQPYRHHVVSEGFVLYDVRDRQRPELLWRVASGKIGSVLKQEDPGLELY